MRILKYFVVAMMVSSISLFPRQLDSNKINYSQLFKEIKNTSRKEVKAASVDTISFTRNGSVFTLKGGTIFQCLQFDDKTHGLYYIGNGNFKLTPPDEAEQMQLFRFYEKKSLNENFNSLFLLFTDSTFNELSSKLNFGLQGQNSDYESGVEDALEFIFDKDESYLKDNFVYPFLEPKSGDLFYAHFNDNNNDPMFFLVDPAEEEDLLIMRKYNEPFRHEYEVVCHYPSKGRGNNLQLRDGSLNIAKYNIDSNVDEDLNFSVKANVDFTPSFNEQQCIRLYLYSEMIVDSILWNNKKPAEYYREEKSPVLWIIAEEGLNKEQSYSLSMYYHSDELLEQNEYGWVSIKSSIEWYPNNYNSNKSNFNLTFHVPSKYKFCSVGDKTLEEENDDVLTTKWETRVPIRNASFNIGLFDEYKLEEEELPPVTVYISEYGHNQLGHIFARKGVLTSSNMDEKFAIDVVNSISLYKYLYGEIPLKQIYVTEIPYQHGEAFPGLVHIAWSAFMGISDQEGMLEQFIAHEVAHQWWGIQVDFTSYHDQWLSEGFADYSGLRYVQAVMHNDVFFKILDKWKEDILGNRKYMFGSGQDAGPVSMGYRTNSSETEGDYQLIVYEKGAWVLHMLRNMMLDLKTMNEDKFENMMKDYFSTYSGKKASTADFQKIVEKNIGIDMNWFFQQWIYDVHIPDYTFAYKTDKTAEGKYKIHCRVKQENVPDNFKMPVNALIKFDEDKFARIRIEVKGNYSEFDLPLMPEEPKEIIFNDLNSVLCNVDYEKW